MKIVDLAVDTKSMSELFLLAEEDELLVRTLQGKTFRILSFEDAVDDEDFEEEIRRTVQNKEFMAFLAERSKEPGKYSAQQVREILGLNTPDEQERP